MVSNTSPKNDDSALSFGNSIYCKPQEYGPTGCKATPGRIRTQNRDPRRERKSYGEAAESFIFPLESSGSGSSSWIDAIQCDSHIYPGSIFFP